MVLIAMYHMSAKLNGVQKIENSAADMMSRRFFRQNMIISIQSRGGNQYADRGVLLCGGGVGSAVMEAFPEDLAKTSSYGNANHVIFIKSWLLLDMLEDHILHEMQPD